MDEERAATSLEDRIHEEARRDDERTAASREEQQQEEMRRNDERTAAAREEQQYEETHQADERMAALRDEVIQKHQAREDQRKNYRAQVDERFQREEALERQSEELRRVQDMEQVLKIQQEQEELLRQVDELDQQRDERKRQEEQDAAKAFKGTFDDTAAMAVLWDRSRQDAKSFDEARARFWHLTNTSYSPEAYEMRNIVKAAGYKLQGEDRAPRLNMDYQLSRPEDAGRQKADLTLSIDHIVPQSDEAGKKRTLDASNLRFMSLRDNSTLGAWNKGKDPEELDTGKTFSKPLSREENDAYRERVNSMRRKKYRRG